MLWEMQEEWAPLPLAEVSSVPFDINGPERECQEYFELDLLRSSINSYQRLAQKRRRPQRPDHERGGARWHLASYAFAQRVLHIHRSLGYEV